jgi:transketolase
MDQALPNTLPFSLPGAISRRDGTPWTPTPAELGRLAFQAESTRELFLNTVARYGRGHCGPCLSLTEILTTLYFAELRIDQADPRWPQRDRFILSKGHGALGLYCTMAKRGLIEEAELATFESLGSRLQGHVDSIHLPWVELTTGSLGQGLSVALGITIGAERRGLDVRAVCVLGDGETQEGNVWEAAMAAAKFRAGRLLAIVDWNRLQGGVTLEVMPSMEPYAAKWQAFGWHVLDIDGHDVGALLGAFHAARQCTGQPSVIIARTVKGKGVSYMENQVEWHGGVVTPPLHAHAIGEITSRLAQLAAFA